MKSYKLEENVLQIIQQVKEEQKMSTETETLEYIVRQYNEWNEKKMGMIADMFLERVEEKYKNMFTRLRLGTTAADKNTQVLLELMNSIIAYKFPKDVLQPTSTFKTLMLGQAEDEVKGKIAYYKQLKDNKDRHKRRKN